MDCGDQTSELRGPVGCSDLLNLENCRGKAVGCCGLHGEGSHPPGPGHNTTQQFCKYLYCFLQTIYMYSLIKIN